MLLRLVSGTNKGDRGGILPHDAGCYKCNKCKVLCPILKEGKQFMSTNTEKIYTMHKNVGKMSREFKATQAQLFCRELWKRSLLQKGKNLKDHWVVN